MNTGKINLPTWQKHVEREISSGKIDIELGYLLADIAFAGSRIGMAIRKYGLMSEITGNTSTLNLHGEQVKKLDLYANEIFLDILKKNRYCAAIVSEEEPDAILTENPGSDYLVFLDPLDGSSNIDSHVSTGSIFSIYKKQSSTDRITKQDLLQAGRNQVAAGYFLYSSSTLMVYSAGHEVNGFTFHQDNDTFYLTHPSIKTPTQASTYSTNEGNCNNFPEHVLQYLDHHKTSDPAANKVTLRYVGSMVADMHRNMLKGGIFLYPSTRQNVNGKLRLMYECNPFAYLIEKTGGKAINGWYSNILDLTPQNIHERCPIIIGSHEMITCFEKFVPTQEEMLLRKQA